MRPACLHVAKALKPYRRHGDRLAHHVLANGEVCRGPGTLAGRQQEELALEAGFEAAVHYELAFGLMGCLVARKAHDGASGSSKHATQTRRSVS